MGFQLTLSDEARDWLVDQGLDQELGVRPLVRAVERYIDTKVAELHAYGLIKVGDVLEATLAGTREREPSGQPRDEIVFMRAARAGEAGSAKAKRPKQAPKTEISLRY